MRVFYLIKEVMLHAVICHILHILVIQIQTEWDFLKNTCSILHTSLSADL